MKQLVPWPAMQGEKPLVAAAYDAIRPICSEIVVVLGHEADAVAAALGYRAFHRASSDPDGPMFDSIRAGLAAAREIDPSATIVLQPGDHPEVLPATLEALVDCSLRRATMAIVPEYDGRGGHPVLVPPEIVALLLETNCPDGLGRFWLEHPETCFRLSVDDAAVIRDVDTPGDLKP